MIENLLAFYAKALPTERAQARWYHTAHDECKSVAYELGVPFKHFVFAVAALSPGCYWERNILGVEQLVTEGDTGYGYRRNRAKALECLAGNLQALRGPKVTRFAANILDPDQHAYDVVVDMWAWRAWEGVVIGEAKSLTPKQYEAIAEGYVSAAKQVGLTPSAFQAVVWTVTRRLGKSALLEQRLERNREKRQAKVSGAN